MKKFYFLMIIFLFIMACGTPKTIQFTPLTPIKTSNVITAQDIFLNADPETRKKMPPNAMDIVILGNEKLWGTLSLYEFKDIFWLSIYIYNDSGTPFLINASDFILMDNNRTIFKRLEPHEASNLYLSKLSAIPPYQYQPKYNISMQSYTTGYVTSSGNISAYTTTTGTIYEDPYSKMGYDLGYTLGLAIIANYNKKIKGLAGAIYQLGLVDGTTVPAKTGTNVAIYWLKRTPYLKPVILRISSTGYEVSFKPKNISN